MAKLFKNWGFRKINDNFNSNQEKVEGSRISFLNVELDNQSEAAGGGDEERRGRKSSGSNSETGGSFSASQHNPDGSVLKKQPKKAGEIFVSGRKSSSCSSPSSSPSETSGRRESAVDEVERPRSAERQPATSSSNDATTTTTWEAAAQTTTTTTAPLQPLPPHSSFPRQNPLDTDNQVILLEDYSDPIDSLVQYPEDSLIAKDDDYAEPEDAVQFISDFAQKTFSKTSETEETLNNEFNDSRPCEDYDKPWEWLPSGNIQEVLGEDWQLNVDSSDIIFVDENGCIMTGRQRHIYETAFDSTVKHVKDPGEFEEIANHPILRNESLTSTPKTSPKLPVTAVTSREMPIPGYLTPKEKRKVTLIRDTSKRESSHFFSFSRLKDNKFGFRTEQVKAIIHAPPRSANSTPLLCHRIQRADSAASSAKSTPTHYSSVAKVNVQMPVKPLSDLTLGAKASKISDGFQTMPHLSSKSCISPRVRKQTKAEMVKSISSEETLFSNASLKIKSSDSSLAKDEKNNLTEESESKQSKETDPRPAEDYDPPWDFSKKKRTLPFSFSLDSAQLLNESNSDFNIRPNNVGSEASISDHVQPKPKLSLSLPLKQNDSSTDTSAPNRTDLFLNFGNQSQKRKQVLQLNFGCAALSVVGEKVDSTLPLERQGWYHGSISRTDAENVLRVSKEGSYLIRNSESNKQDYSLSLKSARGFMHMKIVHSDGKYILGQFSKPFNSIPEMIHHYSINKLPIKGAEHMSLLYPVIDQLL